MHDWLIYQCSHTYVFHKCPESVCVGWGIGIREDFVHKQLSAVIFGYKYIHVPSKSSCKKLLNIDTGIK